MQRDANALDAPGLREAGAALSRDGFALVEPAALREALAVDAATVQAWASYWDALPPDRYLKDGGRYRFRRHASATFDTAAHRLQRAAHRPHYQPTTYNALHGGILRWFEPIDGAWWQLPLTQALIARLGALFAALAPQPQWFIEAHQFRIDASTEVGKPTPEGAHRDGVDFVALLLVRREGVEGGATTIYDADRRPLLQTTLAEPLALMLLDDRRVVHETTPIRRAGLPACRDTLVLTYRSGGFMAPEAS
jgi:hypothetical protein